MDTIRFEKFIQPIKFSEESNGLFAKIFINDISLLDIIQNKYFLGVEEPIDLTYVYTYPYAVDLYANIRDKYSRVEDEEAIGVLICKRCQDLGCNGILVDQNEKEECVEWTNFFKSRGRFEKRERLTFKFDKKQFWDAVDDLENFIDEYKAEERKNNDAVNAFIKDDADINAIVAAGTAIETKNDKGETALMVAAGYDVKVKTVKALIRSGADVNANNRIGMTALMNAAKSNQQTEIIRSLIAAGADVNAKNNEGETALFYAAAENKNPEIIKIFIDNGANVNAKDHTGKTALMFAAEYSHNTEVIRFLIESGADLTIKDDDGYTALDFAENNYECPEIFKMLSEKVEGKDS